MSKKWKTWARGTGAVLVRKECSDAHEWLIFSIYLYLGERGSVFPPSKIHSFTRLARESGRPHQQHVACLLFLLRPPSNLLRAWRAQPFLISPRKKGDIFLPRAEVPYFTSELRHSEVSVHLSTLWGERRGRGPEGVERILEHVQTHAGFCGIEIHFLYYLCPHLLIKVLTFVEKNVC